MFADVTSANIVGYQSVYVPQATWVMAATPFEDIGGGGIPLSQLVKGVATTTIASSALPNSPWKTQAPQIQLQQRAPSGAIAGTGNDSYYYVNNAQDSGTGDTKPGWCNAARKLVGGAQVADILVAPGTAYWYRDPGAASTISIAGQVVSGTAKTVTVPAGMWQMVCNPFPVAITLASAKMTFEGLPIVASSAMPNNPWKTQAAQVQIQQRDADGNVAGTGNDSYYYVTNAQDSGTADTKTGWCNAARKLVGGAQVQDIVIPSGSGFWFYNPSANTTITFAL